MAGLVWSILSVLLLASQHVAAWNGFVEVKTSVGRVRGHKQELEDGKTVNQFFGIPYAKPPVGELRWKETVPVEPWEGVLDASKLYPPHCPQTYMPKLNNTDFKFEVPGEASEDCLYLNIYTPAYATPKSKLSVIFAIHGGGFTSGTALNGEGTIITAYTDVVVVTINYRLNILGFAKFPGSDSTGNYGMYDQVTALKWVRDNIENFGGDPESITITGCSAGGMAVSLLTLSPLAKGLFKRGIAQSGAATAFWAVSRGDDSGFLKDYGEAMNCTGGVENIQPCLKEKTAEDLLQGYQKIQMQYPLFLLPRVDGKFLVEDPRKSLKTGNFNDVDQMIGICKDEGDNLVHFMERMMGANNVSTYVDMFSAAETQLVKDAIVHEYNSLEDEKKPNQGLVDSSDYITDYMFKAPAVETTEMVAKAGKNVHYYVFAHKSRMTVYPEWSRVPHGDDVGYVSGVPFNISGMTFMVAKGFTDMERGLSMATMKMFSNFAKTGNPSIPEDKIDWPKYTIEDPAYLEITLDPTVKRGIKSRRTDFWNEYIPKLKKLLEKPETQPTESDSGKAKDEL